MASFTVSQLSDLNNRLWNLLFRYRSDRLVKCPEFSTLNESSNVPNLSLLGLTIPNTIAGKNCLANRKGANGIYAGNPELRFSSEVRFAKGQFQEINKQIAGIGKNFRNSSEFEFSNWMEDLKIRNLTCKPVTGRDCLMAEEVHQLLVRRYWSIKHGGAKANHSFYALGYCWVGIFVYAFISFILYTMPASLVWNKLYFLARDGKILRKVYDLLTAGQPGYPKSAYLLASRRALNLAAIKTVNQSALEFLCSGSLSMPVGGYLRRIGLDPSQFAKQIQQAGWKTQFDLVSTKDEFVQLINLFTNLPSEIIACAKNERMEYVHYLETTDLIREGWTGLVDIGWHGSLQESLSQISKEYFDKIQLYGFYFGTFAKARTRENTSNVISGYYLHHGQPEKNYSTFRQCIELFEFFLTSHDRSLMRFRAGSAGSTPQYENVHVSEEQRWRLHYLQSGILHFIEDFVKLTGRPGPLVLPQYPMQFMERILINPPCGLASLLGSLTHNEGFGNISLAKPLAKPQSALVYLRKPGLYLSDLKASYWKSGFDVQIPFFVKWYVRVFLPTLRRRISHIIKKGYWDRCDQSDSTT